MATEEFLAAYDRVLAQWPVVPERVDVPSRFGTTRVNVTGPAGAPPLVLLPGGGATSTVWFATVGELARTHRVCAVDMLFDSGRGVYDGDKVAGRADLMEWLDTTLDGLGVTGAGLAGHSYGAWIALRYALHAPDRVRRLALLDPTKCFARQRLGYAVRGVRAVLAGGDVFRGLLAWETGGRATDPVWTDLMCTKFGGRTSLVWPARPRPAELRGLRMPLLVLVAARSRQHDPARLAANARRLVPGARVVTLPDASHHTMPTEDAATIATALLDFFDAV